MSSLCPGRERRPWRGIYQGHRPPLEPPHPGTQHILSNSLFLPRCPSLICKQSKERDPFCSSLYPECQNKGPHPKWSLVTSKSCSLPSSSAERGLCKTQRQGLQAAGPGTLGSLVNWVLNLLPAISLVPISLGCYEDEINVLSSSEEQT